MFHFSTARVVEKWRHIPVPRLAPVLLDGHYLTGRITALAAVLLVLVGFAPMTAAGAAALQRQATLDGEIELSWSVDKQDLTTAADNAVRFAIAVSGPVDVLVEFEPVADELGVFQVLDRIPAGPSRVDGGRNEWRREYLLQPPKSGELTIPALDVAFYRIDYELPRKPCNGRGDCPPLSSHRVAPEIKYADSRRDLSTEAIAINVAKAAVAIVPVATASAQPETTPVSDIGHLPGSRGWVLLGVAASGMLLLAGWLRLRVAPTTTAGAAGSPAAATAWAAGSSAVAEVRVSATEDISSLQQQLASLAMLPDHEPCPVAAYDHLFGIIQRFLRRTAGSTAQARTTEQWRAEDGREELVSLLEHVDRVRYGGHFPAAAEVNQAIGQARALIADAKVGSR